MKYILTSALLASSVFASVVPRDSRKVDYSGFKLLRLENTEGLEAKIEELSAHVLNPGKSAQLDVVVSPDNVDAITSLAESKVINDDVGAILAEEGDMGVYAGRSNVAIVELQYANLQQQCPVRAGLQRTTRTRITLHSCAISRAASLATLRSSPPVLRSRDVSLLASTSGVLVARDRSLQCSFTVPSTHANGSPP